MKKKCDNCGKITEHHPTDSYCLECDENLASAAILRWIKQYKDWTGKEDWEFNMIEYDRVLSERMYRMAVDGHSITEISSVLMTPKSKVNSLVLRYCNRNDLEIPFKKRKIKRRKPRIVRQCPICKLITATYEGSGYETVCHGCTNFPEEMKQRTKIWIATETASAEATKVRRNRPYKAPTRAFSKQCDDDIFFGYLKVDFDKWIITPVGKEAKDMYQIIWDIQKVWELCNPMWSSFILKDGTVIESTAMSCPAILGPSLKGPNGISCFLAPFKDWKLSVDLRDWWFNMQGELVTFLSMNFSDWLRHQYIANEKSIDEIANLAVATVYSIEYALNELSIPLRERETFE